MFQINLGIPPVLFRSLRGLYPRVVRRLNQKLNTQVQPALQQDLADLVEEPGPVEHPFEFGTPKSRRWYFANMVPKGSKGGSYRRTHALIKAWRLKITRQSDKSYIVVYNERDEARYVYGLPFVGLHLFQRQIPGHTHTGWGKEMKVAMALIQEHGVELIREAYQQTLQEEIRS